MGGHFRAAIAALACVAAVCVPPAAQAAAPVDSLCTAASPLGLPCTALDKIGEGLAAQCRKLGIPDTACVLPVGHEVLARARSDYLASWAHRAVAFQYQLQDALPLGQVQWVGTHNSFNSANDTLTISHLDSNQQMSLEQQLDVDVRAIEIDIHFINGVPTVCHGQGPEVGNLGCTTEPPLSAVLPQIAGWLNRPEHRSQVILLYVEDELDGDASYPPTVAQFDRVLRRPDGHSLIYRPRIGDAAANGCVTLPRSISRDDVRAAGAQIVMVGKCSRGWASDVFNWSPVEVESGSTAKYKPFPACDASYNRSVYDQKIVRYFEDSTFVSAATDPTRPPANPEALTPEKAAAMSGCGVNLFGFDQLLPGDGRLAATVWSWAENEPDARGGSCTMQLANGRWAARPCSARAPAACRTKTGTWGVSRPVVASRAGAACRRLGASFRTPRTGYENSLLHQASPAGAWLAYRIRPARR